MGQRKSDIQQDIQNVEDIRADMVDKLERLRERIHETINGIASTVESYIDNTLIENAKRLEKTVEGVRSTIDDMLEDARGTVDDRMETFKHTLDLEYLMNQHPWLVLAGAILMGYTLGSSDGRTSPTARATADRPSYYSQP